MIFAAESLSDLADSIISKRMYINAKDYQTYDEAWEELFLSFDHLRKKLGEDRYDQIVDMAKQAKLHYDTDEIHWASWLMQDIEHFVRGKPPFAYPEEKYRWPKLRLANKT